VGRRAVAGWPRLVVLTAPTLHRAFATDSHNFDPLRPFRVLEKFQSIN